MFVTKNLGQNFDWSFSRLRFKVFVLEWLRAVLGWLNVKLGRRKYDERLIVSDGRSWARDCAPIVVIKGRFCANY